MSAFKKKLILLDEVPSDLKDLPRILVRKFYTKEDVVIIDLLVHNSCMMEDDIAELTHFEKKQLRARLVILKKDKFIHERSKMETGPNGKTKKKVNYYFIHYQRFVNVVKYKLYEIYKMLDVKEKPTKKTTTFRCLKCQKTFTELEADQLFDIESQEFRCTICSTPVEEDDTESQKKDSRLILASFNEKMQGVYDILDKIEEVHLSQKVLDPEPANIHVLRNEINPDYIIPGSEPKRKCPNLVMDEYHLSRLVIDIKINFINNNQDCEHIVTYTFAPDKEIVVDKVFESHNPEKTLTAEDDDENVPDVFAGGKPYPIDEIEEELIEQMTPQEKKDYIEAFQSYYSEYCD